LADRGGSPFDHAAQSELKYRVEEALRQIPEVFRTVVVLREIEGFAYEEIAEILNVNIGTVKSRLTRGRSALRALLVVGAKNSATSTTSVPSNLHTGAVSSPGTVTR
jgi:RNA polymerase sigma-70 factor, ECF subfamily